MSTATNWSDPRSVVGQMSRGSNIYNGGNNNATRSTTPSINSSGGGGPIGRRGGSGGGSSSTPPAQTNSGPIGRRPGPSAPPTPPALPGGNMSRPGNAPQMPSTPTLSPTWIQEGYAPPGVMDQIGAIAPLPAMWNPPTTDPMIEAARTNATSAIEMLNNQASSQEQSIQSQLQAILDRLGLAQEDAFDANEQQMASQGIFRSGINTQTQGRIGEQFNMQAEDASSQTQNIIDQMYRDLTSQISGIEAQLRSAEGDFAQRVEQQTQQAAQQQAAAMQARQDAIDQILNGVISPSSPDVLIGALNPTSSQGSYDRPELSYPSVNLAPTGQMTFHQPSTPASFSSNNSAQYGGGPAQIDDAVRRRLYGS